MLSIFKFEMVSQRKQWLIWTISIVILNALMMFIYSTMVDEMANFAQMFENLGAFGEAMGLSSLNIGTVLGYYGVEVGLVCALGGSMFAAISAITILSKEESYHTAEFLFTHPLSRIKITLMKLLSVTIYVTLIAIVFLITGLISFLFFEGPLPYQELIAYHGRQWLMFLQIMGICFLLSAFYRKQNIGTGLGLVLILYFLLIVYNLSEDMWFLRYVTPFVYADAALILGDGILRVDWILFGCLLGILCAVVGIVHYHGKDLAV